MNDTGCSIVGGGPAGVMLAYLLARKGVDVTLLEAHRDFDRSFRGDSLNASVMEVMDDLGLSERLLQIPHSKIEKVTIQTDKGMYTTSDYSKLKTRHPYIVLMPQNRFLEFLVDEARAFPNFHVVMGATAQELIREHGRVRGVVYQEDGARKELRSLLTVGTDGRNSKMRQLSGLTGVETSPPMDVLWFRLPRNAGDANFANLSVHIGRGYYLALTDRPDHWQISYVVPKGSSGDLRTRGLEAFKESVTSLIPAFADRIDTLSAWNQIFVLSVRSNRLRRWHLPGLLLIGDAAHVMSSVGGLGIHCAIMDAVAAANACAGPLANGTLEDDHLASVQRARYWPTRAIQWFQAMAQKSITAKVLAPDRSFELPVALRVPFLRSMAARITGLGIGPERVRA